MKRYGESFILKQDLMDTIASYMDDDIREFHISGLRHAVLIYF